MKPRRHELAGHPFVPLMMDVSTGHILVVGGGLAALQKIKSLALSGASIRITSPVIIHEIRTLARQYPCISLSYRTFHPRDLLPLRERLARFAELLLPGILARYLQSRHASTVRLVYTCTNNLKLNSRISAQCHALGIPVCDASNPAQGSFISPGVIREGPYILALGSGGMDLQGSRHLRKELETHFRSLARTLSAHKPDTLPP